MNNLTEDTAVKLAIADRATKLMNGSAGIKVTKIEMLMDIDYVNKICPLRLRELLESDEYNFAHDIYGIYRHFNRQTKQLENCFLPRFAA